MKTRITIIFSIPFLLAGSLLAQNIHCPSDQMMNNQLISPIDQSNWLEQERIINRQIDKMFNEDEYNYKAFLDESNQITIPVVFHIVATNQSSISNVPYYRILHQLTVLNEAFNGGGVKSVPR